MTSTYLFIFILLAVSIGEVANSACATSKECRESKRFRFAKYIPEAANGKCLYRIQPQEKDAINTVLNRFKITPTGNGRTPEYHGLAEVIHAVDTLGKSNTFQFHQGVKARYEDFFYKKNPDDSFKLRYKKDKKTKEFVLDENGEKILEKVRGYSSTCDPVQHELIIRKISNQASCAVETGRNHVSGNNPAHIAHEWAHCLGNMTKEGKSIYISYKEAVPRNKISSCLPTCYSEKIYNSWTARNEEFAEVFSLYLTYPDLLHSKPGCEKAFSFFTELFEEYIPPEGPKAITCESRANDFKNYTTLANGRAPVLAEGPKSTPDKPGQTESKSAR